MINYSSSNEFLNINEELYKYIHPDSKINLDNLFIGFLQNKKMITTSELATGRYEIGEPIVAMRSYYRHKYGAKWYNVFGCFDDYFTKQHGYYVLSYSGTDRVRRCRYIMSGMLGLNVSEFPPFLHVHHIDGCRINDSEENLFLTHKFLHPIIHSFLYDKEVPDMIPPFEVLYRFSVDYIFFMLDMYLLRLHQEDINAEENVKTTTFFYGKEITLHDYDNLEKIYQRINELLIYYELLQTLYKYINNKK